MVQGKDERYATVKPRRRDTDPRPERRWSTARSDISVGVRPEKIRLREPSESDPTPTGHNVLHGVVRDASYIGVSTQYQVEARGRRSTDRVRAERRTRHLARAVGAG